VDAVEGHLQLGNDDVGSGVCDAFAHPSGLEPRVRARVDDDQVLAVVSDEHHRGSGRGVREQLHRRHVDSASPELLEAGQPVLVVAHSRDQRHVASVPPRGDGLVRTLAALGDRASGREDGLPRSGQRGHSKCAVDVDGADDTDPSGW
jgi:hypothetical protein